MTWINRRSRSKRFIWTTVIVIAVGGILAAAVIDNLRPDRGGFDQIFTRAFPGAAADPTLIQSWNDWLVDPDTTFVQVLEYTPLLALAERAPFNQFTVVLAERNDFDQAQRDLIAAQYQAAVHPDSPQAEQLEQWAGSDPPRRYANYARAVIFDTSNKPADAAAAYEREGQFDEAEESRRRAVSRYMMVSDYDALARLADDPKYAPVIGPVQRFQIAASQQEWLQVWAAIPAVMFGSYSLGTVALTIISGLFWLAYLVVAGEVRSLLSSRFGLCLLGVFMGVVSIAVTLFFIVFQEQVFGLTQSTQMKQGLLYCLAGVGLREELAKLLCFAPLAPILIRRRSALEMLIVGGCVGLGFAIEENVQYFGSSLGADAAGRFITANFFHIAATALTGLALCHVLHSPAKRIGDFLVIFFGVVIAHGLYDAMLIIDAFQEYAIASSIIYILLAYQFFGEFHTLRTNYHPPIALTYIFAVGFTTTFALAFNYYSYHMGVEMAAQGMIPTAVNAALISFVFIRQVPEDWTD